MDYRNLHSWSVTPFEARQIQNHLRSQLRVEKHRGPIRLVAGADISFERFSDVAFAAFVVLDFKTLEIVATSQAVSLLSFPYIPGLLTFREAGPLIEAWKALRVDPDIVVFDGHGIAHPRRLGIAAHMGLILDRPTFGCGKSLLIGNYSRLGEKKGSTAPLLDGDEQIGVALRTKDRTNPVFISRGHKIDLETCVRVALATTRGYRIPEPTRQAHLLANELRREAA